MGLIDSLFRYFQFAKIVKIVQVEDKTMGKK